MDDFDQLTGELLPWIFDYEEDEDGNFIRYIWSKDGSGKAEVDGLNDEGNECKVLINNHYHNCPAWKIIMEKWPEEREDFDWLITQFWGEPYACIPSNIHKEYCNRDAYFTGLLKQYCLSKYSELCYYTYCNNLRFESLLHLEGCYIDLSIRDKMELQCLWMIVWGKLNTTKWAVHEQLKWYSKLEIPEIPMISRFLAIGYDPCDSKSMIMDHLSDTSESGIDEEFFKEYYGEKLTEMFIGYIKEYCYRIDSSFSRSRKVFNDIDWELNEYFKPDYGQNNEYCSWTIEGKQYKIDIPYDILTTYYKLKISEKMIEIFQSQFKFDDINKLFLPQCGQYNLPSKLYMIKDIAKPLFNGELNEKFELNKLEDFKDNLEEYTLDDVMDWCDGVFNYNSIKVSPYMKFMVYDKYRWIINQGYCCGYPKVPRASNVTKEDFDKVEQSENELSTFNPHWIYEHANSVVKVDEDGFKQSDAYKWYKLHGDLVYALYSCINEEGYYCTVPTGEKDKKGNPIMGWNDEVNEWMNTISEELPNWYDFALRFMGLWTLSDEDLDWFENNIDDIDITEDSVQGFVKLEISYTIAKKYTKAVGTYLRGHFTTYNAKTNDWDENAVNTVQWEGNNDKAFMPFFANSKKSKRWSSCYHTIPSKSEVKRIIVTPKGYLASYFDISGCEIRTISYKSGDKFMMDCYNQGLDPYLTMAAYTFPDHKDDKAYLKSWRPVFKMILLGLLYGMGEDKLADMAELSVEEARKTIDDLWARCPTLKEFVEKKSQWAEDHPGYVESALGDVLELDEGDGEDRLARLGINQYIQNYSSVSLCDGFYNCIAHSIHKDDPVLPNVLLRPLGVIHDSCQIYFPTTYLFRMDEYYRRNLTDYLYKIHGIYYTFDLAVFTNFYDECEMKQLDPHKIEVEGNYTSLKELVEKCVEDGLKFRITSLKDKEGNEISINGYKFGPEFKPKLYKNALKQFIDFELYAKFNEDRSKFKMMFEELPGNPGWTWSKEELEAIGVTTETVDQAPAEPVKRKWVSPF